MDFAYCCLVMQVRISPSAISGIINANPSKSHAQRAIVLAALAHGTSILHDCGTSDDVLSALCIAECLGSKIHTEGRDTIITGNGILYQTNWPCGESGLCLRMFAAIAALQNTPITLTAEGTLLQRPSDFLQSTFQQLGVPCDDHRGYPPLTISGPLRPGEYFIDGSSGSQLLTGLLIAFPLLTADTILHVSGLKSKPYIDLTLDTMRAFGVHASHDDYRTFHIHGNQYYEASDIAIDGDWSGSACILVAAAIAGDVTISGLRIGRAQADERILEILRDAGAQVQVLDTVVHVAKGELCAFDFDATHCPDLFPPLVALAAYCRGVSRIAGVHRLYSKESDRAQTLISEFQKQGVAISKEGDMLCIRGGGVHGGTVLAHGDHRIAMALACAATGAMSPVVIEGAECVRKSYHAFFADLQALGATVSEIQ